MPPLTILTDAEVKSILHDLHKYEIEELQQALSESLNDRSITQPVRTVIESKESIGSSTTLFMPSTSSEGLGMKVVTLPAGGSVGNATPQGALTIMANDGKPIGFLNAEELTAFRTALTSSLLMVRRTKVKIVTVFGAGKQAYWHVRLALLLHGRTIQSINVINHSSSMKTQTFLSSILNVSMDIKKREGWTETKFNILVRRHDEYSKLLKQQVRDADIILCTTPSMSPLFPHEILTELSGRMKARLIIAVGSYTKQMIELPPEIIRRAVEESGELILVDNSASLTETGELTRAGIYHEDIFEIGDILMIDAQFLHARDSYGKGDEEATRAETDDNPSLCLKSSRLTVHLQQESDIPKATVGGLERTIGAQVNKWLGKGDVIYKSVGLGLMDLCVGTELLRLARKRGVGTSFTEF